jgi:hypothetical protein
MSQIITMVDHNSEWLIFLWVESDHSNNHLWFFIVSLDSSHQDYYDNTNDVIIGVLVCFQGLFLSLFFSFLHISWNLCQVILTITLKVVISNHDFLKSHYPQPWYCVNWAIFFFQMVLISKNTNACAHEKTSTLPRRSSLGFQHSK